MCSIACSQALLPTPAEQIRRFFRRDFAVAFTVECPRPADATGTLVHFNSDLALVFEPMHLVDFEVITPFRGPSSQCSAAITRSPTSTTAAAAIVSRTITSFRRRRSASATSSTSATSGYRASLRQVLNPTPSLIQHYVLHEGVVRFPEFRSRCRAGAGHADTHSARDLVGATCRQAISCSATKRRALPVATSRRFATQLIHALEEVHRGSCSGAVTEVGDRAARKIPSLKKKRNGVVPLPPLSRPAIFVAYRGPRRLGQRRTGGHSNRHPGVARLNRHERRHAFGP